MKKRLILTGAITATLIPLATVVACGKKDSFKIYSPEELTTASDFTNDLDYGSKRFDDVELNAGLQKAVVFKLKSLFDKITPLYTSESQFVVDFVTPKKNQALLDGYKKELEDIKGVWTKFQQKITEKGSRYLLSSPIYFSALSGIKGVTSQINQVQDSIVSWTNFSYKTNAGILVQSGDNWIDLTTAPGNKLSSREFYYVDGTGEFSPLTVTSGASAPGWQNDGKHGSFSDFWQKEVEAQYNTRINSDGTVDIDKFKAWLSSVLKVYGCSIEESQKPNPVYDTISAALDTFVARGGLPSDAEQTRIKNIVQADWDGKTDGYKNVYDSALDNDQYRYFKKDEFIFEEQAVSWQDDSGKTLAWSAKSIPNKKAYNTKIEDMVKNSPFNLKEWMAFAGDDGANLPITFIAYDPQVPVIAALQKQVSSSFVKSKTWKDVDFANDWTHGFNGPNQFCLRPAEAKVSSVWSEEYKPGMTFLQKVQSGTIANTTVQLTDPIQKTMYSLTESINLIGNTYGLRGVINALRNIIVSNYTADYDGATKYYKAQAYWDEYTGQDAITSSVKDALKLLGRKIGGVN